MQCSFHLVIAKKLMRSDHVGKKKNLEERLRHNLGKAVAQLRQGCGTTEAKPWDN